MQKRYYEIIDSPMLDSVLDSGRDYAKYLAQRKLSKVYNKVGLGRKR
jgi:tryptophanyl-tRNA synthetase